MRKDLSRVFRGPGELIKAPTNLSTTFPYGGTRLGYSEDGLRFRPGLRVVGISGEPGTDSYDYRYVGGNPQAVVRLRQWDDDTIQLAFPEGLTTATSVTERVVQYPGTFEPGEALATAVFLWVPNDRTHGKCALFRKAGYILGETEEVVWSGQAITVLPITLYLMADTTLTSSDPEYNSRVAQIGFLEDLTL